MNLKGFMQRSFSEGGKTNKSARPCVVTRLLFGLGVSEWVALSPGQRHYGAKDECSAAPLSYLRKSSMPRLNNGGQGAFLGF